MAERSFAQEVEQLKLGQGQHFHGEGILAITKALLQAGVSYVGGYQGAPVSHLMDVLADAKPLLDELGVHFEVCANEAAAAAMLGASINYPMRGAVVWKSTVGTNVASDALSNLASAGVRGGALILLGEDYGEGASIIQERTHAFAMKSAIWLLDPRPDQPHVVRLIEQAFELSEASQTPVMMEYRIRACHLYGSFACKDNLKPAISRNNLLSEPDFDYNRICLPPATYTQEKHKIEQRLPAALAFIQQHQLNEILSGDIDDIGIICQGGLYNTLLRALQQLGLADVFGTSRLPVYVLNVTYPLVSAEVTRFCANKKAVLMVEESQPDFLEQALNVILRKADLPTRVYGKDVLPMAGEYTAAVMLEGVTRFVEQELPQALDNQPLHAALDRVNQLKARAKTLLAGPIPPRPPSFCTGCPERPVFSAIKLVEKELGKIHIASDIGCHTFSTLPPFNLGNSVLGYGLGLASASAVAPVFDKRVITVMGDGGFWHNGLTSGVANAVFNNNDSVLIVMNNGYTSATGQQTIPSSTTPAQTQSIQQALRGFGVRWVRTVTTYQVGAMMKTLKEAMRSKQGGLKVIIAESECQLARQRRLRPLLRQRLAAGKRVIRTRFGVDAETCTGDHSCIRLSGCPSLTIKPNPDPLRTDPIAHVNNGCVGCGLCGEVADAAALCPSFYRAEIIQNPKPWERWLDRFRRALIGKLQSA
ncbi:MAG: indolepyruvate ferredoxin oxidoreductase subunit alpha [Candidatus Competibacteraceae bacterium]|nr:indolepyruvate ferredoxin oxidoreductase subunit alpha [Candidatus Competibacteraceae bacterium]